MLKYIDFTEDLLIPDDERPRVREGKFIHVANKRNGEEYLVFSPMELDAHHRNILERFCSHTGLPGRWVRAPGGKTFRIEEPGWVVGGGYMAIDDEAKSVFLSGFSFAYGETLWSHNEVQRRLLDLPEFAGYRTPG
jgi:hypothetical protein